MKRHLGIIYHYTILTFYVFWMLLFDALKVHKLLNLTIKKARPHANRLIELDN